MIGFLAKDLNLRVGPGTGHTSRGLVGRGKRVSVLDGSGDWVQVRVESGDHSGKVGWMWRHDIETDR